MRKRLLVLVLLILLILPSSVLAESSNKKVVEPDQPNMSLTFQEIEKMIRDDEFGDLEVHKTITEEEIGTVKRITIKNDMSKVAYLSNRNDTKNLEPAPIEVYSIAYVMNSETDGSYSATLYVKSTFDKITRNGMSYAKIVSSEYKVDIQDGSFRPKSVKGRLGQTGMGAVDYNGNAVSWESYSKDFSRNYPNPGTWYKTTGNADRYFSTHFPDNYIGSWAEATIERFATGKTFTIIVDAYL